MEGQSNCDTFCDDYVERAVPFYHKLFSYFPGATEENFERAVRITNCLAPFETFIPEYNKKFFVILKGNC